MDNNSVKINIVGALTDEDGTIHSINDNDEAETVFCVSFKDVDGEKAEVSTKVLGEFRRCHLSAIIGVFAKAFSIDALTDALEDLCDHLDEVQAAKENSRKLHEQSE